MSSVSFDRPANETFLRTPTEEFLHSLTHGLGIVLSLAGASALVALAASRGDVFRVTGCAVYGITLIGVYTASTLSHLYFRPQLNRLFRALDQGFIYLLIVGTYTPLAVAYLRTPGWILFSILLWVIALYGFISKVCFKRGIDGESVWLYLVLGWMESVAFIPLFGVAPTACLVWIAVGGGLYTLGTVFLLHDKREYQFHAIWHVFVLAGSCCHFYAIVACIASSQT
jgi:hemolysin III